MNVEGNVGKGWPKRPHLKQFGDDLNMSIGTRINEHEEKKSTYQERSKWGYAVCTYPSGRQLRLCVLFYSLNQNIIGSCLCHLFNQEGKMLEVVLLRVNKSTTKNLRQNLFLETSSLASLKDEAYLIIYL